MQAERQNEIETRMRWLQDSLGEGDWDCAEGECKALLEVLQAEVARLEELLETEVLAIGLNVLAQPVNEEQRAHLIEQGIAVGEWEEAWRPAKTVGGGWAVLDTRNTSWLRPPLDTQECAQERADFLNQKIRVDVVEQKRRDLKNS